MFRALISVIIISVMLLVGKIVRTYSYSASSICLGLRYCHRPSKFSKLFCSDSSDPRKFEGYKQPETKRNAVQIASTESKILMPCVILVNPYLDANVGSVSRAMLNFGLTELRIVSPECDHLSDKSRALAAGSYEILENAKIFSTLSECVSDLQRVAATTVRPRHMTQVVYTPSIAAEVLVNKENNLKVGVLFGRERSGLTNEEVALADSIITIPTFKHFSSLNLAQAVNIIGYEFWKRQLELVENVPPEVWLHQRNNEPLVSRNDLNSFLTRLEDNLDKRNYQNELSRRVLCFRNIRNIFQRTLLTKREVSMLQGVLSTLIKDPIADSEGVTAITSTLSDSSDSSSSDSELSS